jgi:hypothetical protein
MIGSVGDLSLKHGTDIPGQWNMLGILDAMPSPIPAQIMIPYTGIAEHMAPTIKNFSNMGRTMLGRPPEAFGATTLLIFREVSV